MYQFRSEPDLLRLLNNRRNNNDCDGLRDEINHQPSKKSQHSLIINNRLRQNQKLDRQRIQQKFLSDSKSECMMINSPLLNQDEKLNLLTCDNNSPDRPSDNQHDSNIKIKIRNISLRLPLSPTTRPRPTPKPKSTSTTKPTTIRPQTPDLTNSRPKSPSQINLANLVEISGKRLPDPPSPISAFEINLSTQSNGSQSRSEMSNVPSTQGLSEEWSEPLNLRALPPSEHPESNRSNAPGQSQPVHLPNHQSSSKLEIKCKDEESEDDDDVLGNEELYSAKTHLSPKDEILPISGPSREVLPIIVQDSNWDDLIAEPLRLQSSQKNSHQLRAFTISILKNERNLTVNSSRSSSSSISEAFHQLLPCSSTPPEISLKTSQTSSNVPQWFKSGPHPRRRGKEVGLKLIERIKCKQTGKDGDKVSYLERLASKMFKIIKEQALKFEEESHWLMSKLVKLTSSNQVLGREHPLYATEV
ncbi:hypothetical protein PPACK8108_LOCUS3679 [Phakopsora pachyrhizi]|uniref:Uncharacterized protein n=1 Tax=Phakopsora pachyrhizi TaxID=170000 RepID=A0AAV0AKH1_PHAPC|nr:hypothetical protein PPACK8108_LOCUS3679 [Phakopsora pachyrhizi]